MMGLEAKWYDTLFAVQMATAAAWERVRTGTLYNPTQADLRVDPYPFYSALRERDPMHRSYVARGWVLSRYDDVRAILGDRAFSADERNSAMYGPMRKRAAAHGIDDPYESQQMSMLRVDPPDHTRLRKLVSKAFTPRAIEAMRPRVRALLDEVLSELPKHGEIELNRALAQAFPVLVIAEMLGVPREDRARFMHWSDEAVRSLGDGSFDDEIAGQNAMRELGDYIWEHAEMRRSEPREDLLSGLVAAEEDGDRLNKNELLSTCVLLLVAGNETTTSLIGNALLALFDHPEQLALLRAEPKRIEGAVDEFLRFDSPVQLTSRMVVEEGELHGNRLRPGQQLVLLLGAANRDPAAFERPDELDVTRENVQHLAFSHGLHRCLGAQLAQLEAGLALEALVTQFPDLRLASDRASAVTWGSNTILRGPSKLHVRY